jgi:hypothetical protein
MNTTSAQASQVASEALRVMAHLSETMQVPINAIQEIYSTEFDRLEMDARIRTFIGVLALARTRTLLRQRKLSG